MKILMVLSNEKDGNKLIDEIERRFKIKKYFLNDNDIKEINNIIKKDKEWLIISNNNINFDVVANQSDKIIYLNYENKILNIEQITKYKRKIIILKNKKEEKLIFKSFDNGHEFYY